MPLFRNASFYTGMNCPYKLHARVHSSLRMVLTHTGSACGLARLSTAAITVLSLLPVLQPRSHLLLPFSHYTPTPPQRLFNCSIYIWLLVLYYENNLLCIYYVCQPHPGLTPLPLFQLLPSYTISHLPPTSIRSLLRSSILGNLQ